MKGTLEERFIARLGPPHPVTGCIEWTGGRTRTRDKKKGYGKINRGGKTLLTHRLAWELKHGPIPEGMKICHECDNPPCCNEEHLFLDTQAANVADREAKGRGGSAKGENNGRAKLTEADVLEIRRRAVHETRVSIASHFGVNVATVSRIVNGKTRTNTQP